MRVRPAAVALPRWAYLPAVVGGLFVVVPMAAMALNVALLTYLVKVGVLFLLIIVFQDTTLFDRRVFGATIVACTIAWTAAEMWVFATTKVLYVEPGSGPGQGSGT